MVLLVRPAQVEHVLLLHPAGVVHVNDHLHWPMFLLWRGAGIAQWLEHWTHD